MSGNRDEPRLGSPVWQPALDVANDGGAKPVENRRSDLRAALSPPEAASAFRLGRAGLVAVRAVDHPPPRASAHILNNRTGARSNGLDVIL